MSHSRATPSADGRSSTPKNNSTSLKPFSFDEKQFPPLVASTKKSGKGPRGSEADHSSFKSSESQNWESGKDALSLESKDRDEQSLIRRKDSYSDAQVGGKMKVDLGSTNTCTPSMCSECPNSTSRKDALSRQKNSVCKKSCRRPPTEFYVAVCRRSADYTPVKSSQSLNLESREDASSLESKDRDQLSLIRRVLSYDAPGGTKVKADFGSTNNNCPRKRPVLPHEICPPVYITKDTNLKEEANSPNVEVGTMHKRKALRKSIAQLDSTYPITPCKSSLWTTGSGTASDHKGNNSRRRRKSMVHLGDYTNPFTQNNKHSQSQDWRVCKDKRNSGFKNTDQSPKRRPFDICSSFRKRNDTSMKDLSIGEVEADEKETEQQTVQVSNKHRVLKPGMVLLKHYLAHHVQVDIVKTCRELGLKPQGFYQPGYTDGSKLRLQMMCLGRNWDPQTKYCNKNTLTDKIPETFSVLVEQAIREAQALIDKEDAEKILPSMSPDICIVNFYTETGRLGLHQDRDESRESMRKGLPIVSFSIGDSAEFLYGEDRDVEKAEQVKLESGDVHNTKLSSYVFAR